MCPNYIYFNISCVSCAHFHRHYMKVEERYHRLFCGHCDLLDEERKKDAFGICPDFEEGGPVTP